MDKEFFLFLGCVGCANFAEDPGEICKTCEDMDKYFPDKETAELNGFEVKPNGELIKKGGEDE